MIHAATKERTCPALPLILGIALLVLFISGCSSKKGSNGRLDNPPNTTLPPTKTNEEPPSETEPASTKLAVSSYCGYPQPKVEWAVDGRCLRGPFRGNMFTENREEEVPLEEAAKACLANPHCKGITAQFNAGVPFSTVTTLSEPFRPNNNTYGCSYLIMPCEQ